MAFDKFAIDKDYDSIEVFQGTSPWVIGDGGSTISIDDGGAAITVDASDLDIRDLAFATDKVDVSGSEVSLDAATLLALETITVTAADLDIRDLAFATDKVDVSGSSITTVDDSYDTWQTTADAAVTDAANGTEIAATPLANRVRIVIQNIGAKDCRLGPDNTLTATKGLLLKRGNAHEMILSATANMFAIGVGGATTVSYAEYAF